MRLACWRGGVKVGGQTASPALKTRPEPERDCRNESERRRPRMRAEIEALVNDINESLALLRRHL